MSIKVPYTIGFASVNMKAPCVERNKGWIPVVAQDFMVVALCDNMDIAKKIVELLNEDWLVNRMEKQLSKLVTPKPRFSDYQILHNKLENAWYMIFKDEGVDAKAFLQVWPELAQCTPACWGGYFNAVCLT